MASIPAHVASNGASEADRIRAAYGKRDDHQIRESPWVHRGYRLRMHNLEWNLLDELARAGLDLPEARVLEVGCGSAYFLRRFLDYGVRHAAGIDLMANRIAHARESDERLELVTGDATQLPWPDASFDLVTQFTCLSSVVEPEARRRIAAEMWRVARPGGVILSYDMRRPSAMVRALVRMASLRRRPQDTHRQVPTSPVELEELRGLFPTTSIRNRSLTLAADLGVVARHAPPLARLLQALPFLRTHLLFLARKAP